MWKQPLAQVSNLTSDPTGQWLTPLISLGGFGLLLVLLLLGRVVTKSTYDELKADRDAWRAASELANQTLATSQAALTKFADKGDVTNGLLSEIKANTQNKAQ